mgnify:CR=1 FL=1|jgi:hypothetical protein
MTRMTEGDRLKHRLTGQLYELKTIKDGVFILQSEETPYRMWFGESDLNLFFEIPKRKKMKK